MGDGGKGRLEAAERPVSEQNVTLIASAVEAYEREGTRAYDVYVGTKHVGEVKRYRERYAYKSLGGNVALFRSRWSWRASGIRRSFDTRKLALEALLNGRS